MPNFEYYKKLNPNTIGFSSFNIGIFLLFSAPAIASFFLLLSLVFSIFLIKRNPLLDKINLLLISIILLMLGSCVIFQFNSNDLFIDQTSKFYTHPIIGLINWIPLFFSYLGFQLYLKTKKSRFLCCMSLIFGFIPILTSGFSQHLLGWYGPFEFLNGLIIWYQRENIVGMKGMTGLFNNPNYTACALATVFPILCATFFSNKYLNLRKITSAVLLILIIIGIFFTASRNGLLALLIGTAVFLIPLKSKLISFSFLSFISVLMINFISNYSFSLSLIPFDLIKSFNFQELSTDPRIEIWKESFQYISKRPLLGWGGNGFSSLWNSNNSSYLGHSHSIPLEISIQYGLITSIILIGTIFFILIKSFKLIYLNSDFRLINFSKDNFFDRGWYASCIAILFSNTIDILYYDIRISLLTWVFLAGLKNIIDEKT